MIKKSQAAYICVHVFRQERPILLVSREDGDWSFLCGAVHENSAAEYKVVGIGHLLHRDPSLLSLLDLEPDAEAERASVDDEWIRASQKSNNA